MAGFVLAIASYCLFFIPILSLVAWVLAIVFCSVGISQTGKDPNLGGRGLAIAGLIISLLGILLAIVLVVLALVFGVAFIEALEEYCDENPEDCESHGPDGILLDDLAGSPAMTWSLLEPWSPRPFGLAV